MIAFFDRFDREPHGDALLVLLAVMLLAALSGKRGRPAC